MIDNELNEWDDPQEKQKRITYNPDELPEMPNDGEMHPSPEMLLIRIAVDKALFNDQRELWCMHAYDKLTNAEIARKLKVSKQSIGQRLKVVEKKIEAYCKEHWEVYETLKEAQDDNAQGC